MVKSYKLASLTGLLALCFGLYAMESCDKHIIYSQKKKNYIINQALLEHCIIIMKQNPNEAIKIIDTFELDPNKATQNVLLKEYKTSIFGHFIHRMYEKMENKIYESVMQKYSDGSVNNNSNVLYEILEFSSSGWYMVGVCTDETKKIKPIEKEDELILEKLFKRKANFYSLTKTPCEKQTDPHATNCITPKKVLSLLTENRTLYRKIHKRAIDSFCEQASRNCMVDFNKVMEEKKTMFADKIEKLAKAHK